MFLDASAIVAILAREDEADALSAKLIKAPSRLTSAPVVWEAVVSLARKRQGMSVSEAREMVQAFLNRTSVELIPIGTKERDVALDAFERFGKGRHPARLNMGDCFAYACAKTNGVPLLFKGDDFVLTDIPAA